MNYKLITHSYKTKFACSLFVVCFVCVASDRSVFNESEKKLFSYFTIQKGEEEGGEG